MSEPETEDRVGIVLVPYLPMRDRQTVGPFELIPWQQVEVDDCLSERAFETARQLVEVYEVKDNRRGVGVIVKTAERPVGDMGDFEISDNPTIRALYRALVVALLEGPGVVREQPVGEEQRSGHGQPTSDNAFLVAHAVSADGYLSTQYGAMVRTTVGGLRLGEENLRIKPPAELHIPLLGARIDWLFAAALFECLTAETDTARRLGLTADWLDIAWRNTTSITQHVRLLALRSGFDAVLDTDNEKIEVVRSALCALLDPPGEPTSMRHWANRDGAPRSGEMTLLGWWFTQFTFVRNSIAHGSAVPEAELECEGELHLWRAERMLRRAIKKTVADQGHEDVLLDPLERATRWAAEAWARGLKVDAEEEPSS